MSALKVALVPRLCVAVLTSVILSGAAGMLLISAYQGFHVNFLILFTYITPAVMLVDRRFQFLWMPCCSNGKSGIPC
ncbi:hypothetical protein Theco_0764 [Thermobacillus composti KWC4]|uniref:Uncharacterized protein n=1 Tax=Thermobacillus composti (strain DSM 18247 / JCM 13945 / KWC4) TaxID=717605 RepID=L0EBG6_THECK|nr:hypothetical protein Theco_0764 [Thermobacillus composti KWC4]